jgi:phage recombination protein Bet
MSGTELMALPPNVVARGLTAPVWNTLCSSVFPGAKAESVLLAVDYCKARNLDVLKKPCHIVPMSVKVGNSYEQRDVIMPGIYELRTTATRTGEYLGHTPITYGPDIEQYGQLLPEWAEMTVFRWNERAARPIEFPTRVLFREVVNLKDGRPNQRWSKAPIQMMDKCLEAAALRKAFPEELGGQYTDDEVADVGAIEVASAAPANARDNAAGDGERAERSRGKPRVREPESTRPDGRERATPVHATPVEAARSDAGATGGASAPAAADAGAVSAGAYEEDTITGAQKAILEKRLTEAKLTSAQFCEAFKIAHIELLPFDMVDNAKSWIQRNAAR